MEQFPLSVFGYDLYILYMTKHINGKHALNFLYLRGMNQVLKPLFYSIPH